MNSRLYIHCGLHKTATTLIQRQLGEAREGLREQGLYLPATGSWPHLKGAHHNVAFELARLPRFHPGMGTLKELRAELAGQEGDALISSEVFGFLLARSGGMAPLVALARETGREPVVIVSLREQASYFASLYLELLKHGYRTDAGLAAEEVLETGTLRHGERLFWFDYEAVLDRIEAQVIVRNYHLPEEGGPVADLVRALGRDPALLALPASARANSAASAGALARFLGDRLQARQAQVGPLLEALDRELAVSPRPSAALVARFVERFAAGNARLAADRGIDLSAHTLRSTEEGALPLDYGFSAVLQAQVSLLLADRFGIHLPPEPGPRARRSLRRIHAWLARSRVSRAQRRLGAAELIALREALMLSQSRKGGQR